MTEQVQKGVGWWVRRVGLGLSFVVASACGSVGGAVLSDITDPPTQQLENVITIDDLTFHLDLLRAEIAVVAGRIEALEAASAEADAVQEAEDRALLLEQIQDIASRLGLDTVDEE